MSLLIQDLRFAWRGFRAARGFTIAAILSLAIGVGANTAIFSVVNSLLLHPLPYKDPERLVILWNRSPGLNIAQDWFSTAQYIDIKTGHSGFDPSEVAIAIGRLSNLTGDGVPERVTVVQASSSLLPLFGATPMLGRLFLRDEDVGKSANTAILTHAMWMRRYGGDPGIVGRTIIINGVSVQVVGVLTRGFALPHEVLPTLYGGDQAEIFVPLPFGPGTAQDRGHEDYNIVGRLKPGVTVAQAQAEMDTLTARLRRDHPDVYPPNGGLTFGIVPLLEQVVGDVRLPLQVLLGSVAFVLLIACANVANLLLSRAVTRQREIAIRAALGASRWRVLTQLLTESMMLGCAGGALGVVLARAGLALLALLGSASVPRLAEVRIDACVLLFTLGVSLVSGIIFGLIPALRLSRIDLATTLKESGRGGARHGNRLRRLLVIAELALSVMLLIGAGLLIRSFVRLHNVSPGFNPNNVLAFDITLTGPKYNAVPSRINAYRELMERLERLPGVTSAGVISALPFSTVWAWGPITVEGPIPPPGENFINADQRVVGGHYFQAMEIPLVAGRVFNEHDTADAPPVVVIDEFMARELWPNQDPLGKRVRYGGVGSTGTWRTVIGVVGRVKQYTLENDSRIALYFPLLQGGSRALSVVVRGAGDPALLATGVRKELREVDSDVPVCGMMTMIHRVNESLGRRRFTVILLGVFAALALTLAVIGTYGVMSYLVTQGEREIGIRIALGATESRIQRWVVGQGAIVAAAGVGIGLVGAFAASRAMRALLYGVNTTDPLTFAVAAGALTLVALVASYLPARRAAKIDPMISLRVE